MIDTEEWANGIQELLDNTEKPAIEMVIARGAAEELVKLLRMGENVEDFEQAYMMGYEHGYQFAVKDVIKHLKGMRWYGGDKQKKRTD